MKDCTGEELGKITTTGCPNCNTAMYDTKDGLFWYCPKCKDWTDRGNSLRKN